MATLDDKKYQLLVDSLVANYITRFGGPPSKEKDMNEYTESIFSHYVNASDSFSKFFNKIPINLSNIRIVDKHGRAMFIDIRNNRDKNEAVKLRTIRYDGILEPRQISETNRFAFYLLLKNDFKESAKRQYPALRQSVSTPPVEQSQRLKHETARGSLEKEFKSMVANGQATDVLAAFKIITRSLPAKDKSDLANSLKSSGINNSQELQGLLDQWKGEVQSQKKPERTQARSFSRGPGMDLSF